jgi:hypothetical protein
MTDAVRLFRRWYDDDRAIFISLFALALLPLLFALDKSPTHGDESEWISDGIKLVSLILRGDFSNPFWFRENWWWEGHVAPYIIGFWLRIFGVSSGEWRFWSFAHYGIDGPPGNAAIPPMNILVLSRVPVALLGALACALMFPLGKLLVNRRVGVVSALFLLSEPLWILSSRRAMTDIVAAFFGILGTYLYVRWHRTQSTRSLLSITPLGVILGIAVEAKYTMVALVIAVILIELVTAIEDRQHRHTGIVAPILGLLMFLGSFACTVVVLDPFLWPNPLIQLSLIIHNPSAAYGGWVWPSPWDSLRWAAGDFNSVVFPLFIGNFDSVPSQPPYSVSLSWQYPGTFSTVPISFLFMIGIAVIFVARQKLDRFARIAILLWLGTYFVMISLILRVFFDRFFIPLIPPICIVAAVGFDRVVEFCKTKRQRVAFVLTALALSVWAPLSVYQNLWGGVAPDMANGIEFATMQDSLNGHPFGLILSASYLIIVAYVIGNGFLRKRSSRLAQLAHDPVRRLRAVGSG